MREWTKRALRRAAEPLRERFGTVLRKEPPVPEEIVIDPGEIVSTTKEHDPRR